jgi:RNA polymerase sigma-70 factor (ECF subfamily)
MIAPANVLAAEGMVALEAEDKREAFEREAVPHLDSVYRFALGLAGDPAYAEDLTQEAMLRAYRSWHRYRPGTNVRAWLTTILRNVAISNYRRARPTTYDCDFSEVEEYVQSHKSWDSDPEARLLDRLTAREVIAAIHTLEPEFRETVLLRDVEGLSYEEVAKQTNVPVGTVKSRLYRGRRALHSRLSAHAADAGVSG